ncbi:MAG TPA: potassium transporter Kup [Stellaceae bacterium]|jgi:KUP system potassium uptake protein|nr:potassium transporter Kup [Stellaceae bacterium]
MVTEGPTSPPMGHVALPSQAAPADSAGTARQNLTLAALGVVYGDIGTSPLYAVRQSLVDFNDLSEHAVLGALSLIVWALVLIVTLKYVIVIMRADNRGEGGLLALTALVLRTTHRGQRRYLWIMAAGLVGSALFYGDGVITPAISVLSAVEGLKIATPLFQPYVIPISLVLLVGLFLMQRVGTATVGRLFGPVMLLWFSVLALLGIIGIVQCPHVLLALNPWYGLAVVVHAPLRGFIMLGAVFLAVTGAEALYADMGHFGRQALRRAWLSLVFPALLLNYFGQGALLLNNPAALENPFYRLAPGWALIPLVALAAMATIIASQAVISGAFSITRQAIQLGYLPRLEVRHTSETEIGQVYVPRINSGLLVAIILLVLWFQTSDNLGAAYGIAVSGMMAITTGLAFLYMRSQGWSLAVAVPVFTFFGLIDMTFFTANLLKIAEGGWFPIVVAGIVFSVMGTWWRGRRMLAEQRANDALPLSQFVETLSPDRLVRVPGTAIFMTRDLTHVPVALLHALKHYKALHQRVVMMQVETEDVPHVSADRRLDILEVGKGFFTMRVRYGFMDEPNIMRALAQCRMQHFHINLMETSFIIGRERLRTSTRHGSFWRWRDRLFILLTNLALDATEFFRIPPNRVVELGGQIEI